MIREGLWWLAAWIQYALLVHNGDNLVEYSRYSWIVDFVVKSFLHCRDCSWRNRSFSCKPGKASDTKNRSITAWLRSPFAVRKMRNRLLFILTTDVAQRVCVLKLFNGIVRLVDSDIRSFGWFIRLKLTYCVERNISLFLWNGMFVVSDIFSSGIVHRGRPISDFVSLSFAASQRRGGLRCRRSVFLLLQLFLLRFWSRLRQRPRPRQLGDSSLRFIVFGKFKHRVPIRTRGA